MSAGLTGQGARLWSASGGAHGHDRTPRKTPYHLAAARAGRMSDNDAEFADFLRVVVSAGKTNHLLNGLRIPVDAAFLKE